MITPGGGIALIAGWFVFASATIGNSASAGISPLGRSEPIG